MSRSKNDAPIQLSLSLHFCLHYLLLNSGDGNEAKCNVFCSRLLVAMTTAGCIGRFKDVLVSRCSKWCPFAFSHAHNWFLCWSTALLMMLCNMLQHVLMRHWFTSLISQTVVLYMHSSTNPKFGCQPCLDVISFQFIQTFDHNYVLLAEHHYLQTSSDISIALFPNLLFKSNWSKWKWRDK